MIVLKSNIINTEEIPEESIQQIIENRIPVLKKIIDFSARTETWVFDKTVLRGKLK
jgi:hypothetical protein